MSVPIDDRGFLLGDGLFETLLWRAGELVQFEAHAERLIAGCAALSLPAPEREALHAAAVAAVKAAGLDAGRAAVRLTWSAGSGGRGLDRPDPVRPVLYAAAAPSPPPAGPAALATAEVRRNDGSPTSRLKTLNYLDNVLARRQARAAGADEALMLNAQGEVACAAVANVFWFEGERLVTPALECGVLAGVVRAQTLRAAAALGLEAVEARAPRERLDAAAGVFLTNSLIGLRPVSSLDGRAVAPHPALDALARAVATTCG
jgi:branched-chain amino acid aminotransferase/4-amino-4-deoxychorismate lyase